MTVVVILDRDQYYKPTLKDKTRERNTSTTGDLLHFMRTAHK
jgi:hypothetical protein